MLNKLKKFFINQSGNDNNKKRKTKTIYDNGDEEIDDCHINNSTMNIKDFYIGRPINRGNLGPIYLAKHKKTDVIIIIKCLEKKKILENKLVGQLKREIEIHSHLNHPNIIDFYGFFHDKKNIFIAWEFLHRGNLYTYLQKKEEKKLDEKVVANIIYQIINALIYLHNSDIIHRDIKPENILIDSDDKVKLMDFGWSIYNPNKQKLKKICGTYCYIAPEMFMDIPYDHKVDIWSLGVLTFELSSGLTPFGEDNNEITANRIINLDFTYPTYFSYELKHFLSKILVQNPNNRYGLNKLINHPWIKNNIIK